MILNQHTLSGQSLPGCQCEALQLGAVRGHAWVLAGVVQQRRIIGESPGIVLLLLVQEQDKMITEMAVAEMDIPVGCLGHMVGVVEAHITVAEEVIPAMRHDSGYDDTKWDSAFKDGEDGWGDLPGGKIQKSPGREAFPGGWGHQGKRQRW